MPLILALLIALLLPSWVSAKQPTKRPTDERRGEILFQQNCWQCHGKRGKGKGPLARAFGGPLKPIGQRFAKSEYKDQIRTILQGRGDMPGFDQVMDRADARRVLIWLDQVKKLFGLGGMEAMGGVLALNIAVASVTLVLLFVVPGLLKKHVPQLAHYLPGTLMGILIMTPLVYMLGLDVELVNLDTQLGSWSELSAMVQAQWPTTWSGDVLTLAFPFALQLAFLCYLDTLLTSLVVDKLVQAKFKSQECTAQNKELLAQGVANASVALIGGIPGAQATIRSVLILNEGATMRIAGVMTGVFVFVEMILFQDLISTIPTAVFAGILFKVGYDVFDWEPVFAALSKDTANKPSPMNWFFIVGTTGITLLMDLNTAVIGFCILFYVGKHFFSIEDMPDGVEMAMSDEN